jgi:hypothetical protein
VLITHRNSAYVDNDELERAAGALEIHAADSTTPLTMAVACCAGACALRVLQTNDVKDFQEFLRVFSAVISQKLEGIELGEGD